MFERGGAQLTSSLEAQEQHTFQAGEFHTAWDKDTVRLFYEGFGEYAEAVTERAKSAKHEEISDEERLILGAARFINYTVRHSHGRPTNRLQIMDRVQNGNYHLVKAAKKHDPEKAQGLIAYFKPFISQYVKRNEHGAEARLDQGELMRVPINQQEYYRVRDVLEGLSIRLDRPVEPEELLQFPDMTFTPEDIQKFNDIRTEHIPFEAVFGPNTPYDLESEEPNDPHSIVAARLPKEGVARALRMLGRREAFIVAARIGLNGQEPTKLDELAGELGLSRSRVSQIENSALNKLRAVPNIIDILNMVDLDSPSNHDPDKTGGEAANLREGADENVQKTMKKELLGHRVSRLESQLVGILQLTETQQPSQRFIVVRVSQLLFYMQKFNGDGMKQNDLAEELGVSSFTMSQLLNKEDDYKRIHRDNTNPDQLCAKLIGDIFDENSPASRIIEQINPALLPLLEELRSLYGLDPVTA